MKLYVWEGVLIDYSSGVMFALANSVDEARELILNDCRLGRVEEDLKGTPDVYTDPIGFTIWGGG